MNDFLSSEEIAQKLGCTRAHVSRMAKLGRIPATRRGRLIVIPRAAWDAFLAQQTANALAGMETLSHAA